MSIDPIRKTLLTFIKSIFLDVDFHDEMLLHNINFAFFIH